MPCAPGPVLGSAHTHSTRSKLKPDSKRTSGSGADSDVSTTEEEEAVGIDKRVVKYAADNAMGPRMVLVPVIGSQCFGVAPAAGDGACLFTRFSPPHRCAADGRR